MRLLHLALIFVTFRVVVTFSVVVTFRGDATARNNTQGGCRNTFICTFIYNTFYNNALKILKYKWRPLVVTIRAS